MLKSGLRLNLSGSYATNQNYVPQRLSNFRVAWNACLSTYSCNFDGCVQDLLFCKRKYFVAIIWRVCHRTDITFLTFIWKISHFESRVGKWNPASFIVHFHNHSRQAPSFQNFSVCLFYKLHTLYRSLNTIMAQPKNCPFGVNAMIELKNITTKSDSYSTIVISRGMFRLTSVPVLSVVFVMCLRSIVVLIPSG
jgi:hypothetical protein